MGSLGDKINFWSKTQTHGVFGWQSKILRCLCIEEWAEKEVFRSLHSMPFNMWAPPPPLLDMYILNHKTRTKTYFLHSHQLSTPIFFFSVYILYSTRKRDAELGILWLAIRFYKCLRIPIFTTDQRQLWPILQFGDYHYNRQ